MLETMHYPSEIRGTAELALPEDEATFTSQEMEMAVMLIDQLTREFEPSQFTDGYRAELERIIEAKLGTGQPVTVAPVATPGRVGDLMEALKASIEATKAERTTRKRAAKEPAKKQAAPTRRTRAKTSP
jgi:DNA end-binding protein Ku